MTKKWTLLFTALLSTAGLALTQQDRGAFTEKGVSTCLDHILHVVVWPQIPSHEPVVRHRIDSYGVLKQPVEQQPTPP